MKNILNRINKVFDQKIRLGIMSSLVINDRVDFNTLKDTLEVTDGRLAGHIKVLEEAEYLQVQKQFIGKKPQTTYSATPLGRKAFTDHLNALEALIKSMGK